MILALYGAGAMGREFKYIADESGEWDDLVFIDDTENDGHLLGCAVYGFQQFQSRFSPEDVRFVISIGEPKYRRKAFERMIRAGYQGGILKHPSAYISPDAQIGEGTAVCFDVHVGSGAVIGRNCYLSRNASVGHDAVINDHTRLGVNSFVGGHTIVGENAFIGAGAMLRDRIHAGKGCIVALGSAVFEDVPDYATMIGNPARMMGEEANSILYAPSRKPERTESKEDPVQSVEERYWEVFSGCFSGLDFNPVTFRYHDQGWDSVAQMTLISRLEKQFGVRIRGRDVLKLRSYGAGLGMIRSMLEKGDGGKGT